MKPKDDLDLELSCEEIEIQARALGDTGLGYLDLRISGVEFANLDVPRVYDAISIEGFLRHHRLTLAEE